MNTTTTTDYSNLSGASRPRPRSAESTSIAPRLAEYLNPQDARLLSNRLARIEGHVHAVRDMIDSQRPAMDILVQIAAIKAALNKFSAALIEHDIETHIPLQNGSKEHIEKTIATLRMLLKQS